MSPAVPNDQKTENTGATRIGEALKAQRRQRNISHETVSAQLHIQPRLLRALEEEKWDEFPARVYREGFLRQYASHLGLDGDALVRQMRDEQRPRPESGASSSQNRTEPRPSSREADAKTQGVQWLFLVGLIVLVVGYYVVNEARKQDEPSPLPPPVQESLPPSETPAAVAPAVPAKQLLSITAKDSVWIRVTSDGTMRFEGILQKGRSRGWEADETFRVQAGYFGALEMNVNGEPLVAPSPNARSVSWRVPAQPVSPASATSASATPASPVVPEASAPPSVP